MKKTVQIVTIPLNKEVWSKDALIKRQPPQITQYIISDKFSNAITESIWQSQQLLVLSDDEILSGNKFVWLDGLDQGVYTAIPMEDYIGRGEIPVGLIGETGRKVIASYPQLEGTLSYPNIETLSISKETVQAWIDAGTPEEGSVTIDKEFDDWYELMELKSYPNWKPVVDTKGNLLLEFGEKIINTLPYPELMKGISEYYKDVKIVEEKPSIPTNKEIDRICVRGCHDFILEKGIMTPITPQQYYTAGYKKALKDLGHE